MKPLINILILVLLFSCIDKKSKKENKAIDNQSIETIKEKNLSNNDSIIAIQGNDSINTLAILTKYNPEDHKKEYLDSNIVALIQAPKKHKEIPPDGTYIYDIAYAEWQGRSMGEKVTVVIKGNTIKIISEGNPSMTAKKGEVLDEGVLIKHNVTGDWLITNNPTDANLETYGGCVGAPMVIDFKNKKYWTC